MSLAQLLEGKKISLPGWITKKHATITLVAIVVSILSVWLYSDSQSSQKQNQIAELVRMNDELVKTISTLKSEIKNRGGPQTHRVSSAIPTFVSVEPGVGFQRQFSDKKELYIPRGAVFRARLITSIKTSIQESFVIAETTNTFEMDSKRRIEKGSRLIGSASMDRALKGVTVKFDTLVTPKGVQYDDLSLLALSQNAFPLIEGIHFSDAGLKYGTALAFGFLSGFANGGMEREPTIGGSVSKPTLANQALSGLSVSSFKIADEAMQSLHDENVEHVVVPAGSDIYVAFNRKWSIQNSEKGILR